MSSQPGVGSELPNISAGLRAYDGLAVLCELAEFKAAGSINSVTRSPSLFVGSSLEAVESDSLSNRWA